MLTKPILRRNPQPRLPDWAGGANDNVPRRSGANDNNRNRNSAPRVYINPKRLARFGRIILRAHPYGRLASNAIDLYDIFSGGQPESINSNGWTLVTNCSLPNPAYNMSYARIASSNNPNASALNFANSCTGLQGVVSIGDPFGGLSDSVRAVVVGKTRIWNGSPRGQAQLGYSRPNTGSNFPILNPAKSPLIIPPLFPNSWVFTANPALVNPAMLPAFLPPVPWALNPIWTAPNREVSNGVKNRPQNVVDNNWSLSVDVVPSGQSASPSSPPKTHTLAPPAKSGGSVVKESKAKMSPAMVSILKGASTITEGLDLLESLYDALPSEYRPKFKNTGYEKLNVTPQEKAKALYNNFDKVDVSDALLNIISNEIEDRFYGELGQRGGTRSKELGLAYGSGINSLTRSVSKSFYDAEQQAKNKVDGEN